MTKKFETAIAAYLATLPAWRKEVALPLHLRPEGEPARHEKWVASRDLTNAIRHAHTLAQKGKISAAAYEALAARYDSAIHST
jgi:hypothetical protein